MSPKDAGRWYKTGAILSFLAILATLVQSFLPRWGRSVSFALTLIGFLAVTRPSWDKHGTKLTMLGMSLGVFLTEFAILWTGLARD
jgi:hypothetical protein